MVTEFPVVVGAEVRQLMVLPVRPQVLDRVQFRSVGRKELHPQPPALLPDEVPDHSAAVTAQAIPDDQQLVSFVSIGLTPTFSAAPSMTRYSFTAWQAMI